MTSTLWDSLACEVNLGRDTKFSKKGNKHISICPGSFYITRDGDHLIHCERQEKELQRSIVEGMCSIVMNITRLTE